MGVLHQVHIGRDIEPMPGADGHPGPGLRAQSDAAGLTNHNAIRGTNVAHGLTDWQLRHGRLVELGIVEVAAGHADTRMQDGPGEGLGHVPEDAQVHAGLDLLLLEVVV